MSNFFKKRFRIIHNDYQGYGVEVKDWFSPWWIPRSNVFRSLKDAEFYIDKQTAEEKIIKDYNPHFKNRKQ